MESEKRVGHVVNRNALPDRFPTDRHEPAFWEALGRAVATFGFLEDTLSKAIFAVTATTHYEQEEVEEAYKTWLPTLERALVDPLGNLIDVYGKAVRGGRAAPCRASHVNVKPLNDRSWPILLKNSSKATFRKI